MTNYKTFEIIADYADNSNEAKFKQRVAIETGGEYEADTLLVFYVGNKELTNISTEETTAEVWENIDPAFSANRKLIDGQGNVWDFVREREEYFIIKCGINAHFIDKEAGRELTPAEYLEKSMRDLETSKQKYRTKNFK